jgi:hypothetical protein
MVALFGKFSKGMIMKKFVLVAVAFAAVSGVAVAGERERDSRLIDPNYNSTTVDGAPVLLNTYKVLKSDVISADDAEQRRLDSKNGYTMIN